MAIAGLLPAAASVHFDTGEPKVIPSGFTALDLSASQADTDCYASSFRKNGAWFPGETSDEQARIFLTQPEAKAKTTRCLISYGRRMDGAATDNFLFSPSFTVEANEGLEWQARSLAHDFPESYEVMVGPADSTDPAEFTPVLTVAGEEYGWTSHFVNLSPYVGREIRVAFRHTSRDAYALCLRNIYAGSSTGRGFLARNTGRRFFGLEDDRFEMRFTLEDIGGFEETDGGSRWPESFELWTEATGDSPERLLGKLEAPALTTLGETLEYALPIDPEFYGASIVRLYAIHGEERETLLRDVVNVSTFARKMLIEKFTGTWCNACTSVSPPFHTYASALGDECIAVEVHHGGSVGADEMGVDDYIAPLPSFINGNYPALVFNRTTKQKETTPYDRAGLLEALLSECHAKVTLDISSYDKQKVRGNVQVTFDSDIDNSDDHMRIGVTVVERSHERPATALRQSNQYGGSTIANYGEYRFMPTKLDNSLIKFHNVVRGPEAGSIGAEKSLPEVIYAYMVYTVPFEIELPEKVQDPTNLFLTATAVNYTWEYKTLMGQQLLRGKTANVLNADALSLVEKSDQSGVADIARNEGLSVTRSGDYLIVRVEDETEDTLRLYDSLGRLATEAYGRGSYDLCIPAGASGVHILRLGDRSAKVVL